jgi:hypothetical protein
MEEDFAAAVKSLVPSVSALEVRHYKSLQKQFVEQR